MDDTLLDTDILSEILKRQNTIVNANAANYLAEHGSFTLSAFSRFEIKRGLLECRATRQLDRFNEFCSRSVLLPVDDAVLEQACLLWVSAYQGGHPRGDADLLIAATCLVHNLHLATGNLQHSTWMPKLRLVDWRQLNSA